MDALEMETMLRTACNTPALCKLNALMRELTGVGLLVVWSRSGDSFGQVPVCDNERELPQFCRLLHEVPQGLHRCVTCHALLALAASGRGQITEGHCHGGACVVASPVRGVSLPSVAELVVISSCAFTLPDRKKGWRVTWKRARDLGIDQVKLRHAYEQLPNLPADKLKLVGEIVDAAAATLTEALNGLRSHTPDRADDQAPEDIETKLTTALQAAHDPAFRHAVGSAPATLVDVVQSVVGANPQLPVTVADIARAAHITPNHFSLIFRRQTGTTFSDFLAEKRFERATERLQDLTLSISEVALQSGFVDPNYFAKVFHKRTGLSPREWRLPKPDATASAKRPSGKAPSVRKKSTKRLTKKVGSTSTSRQPPSLKLPPTRCLRRTRQRPG
jgi:AraC-like DNA-binding protein